VKAALNYEDILSSKDRFEHNIASRKLPVNTSFDQLKELRQTHKLLNGEIMELRRQRKFLAKQTHQTGNACAEAAKNLKKEISDRESSLNEIDASIQKASMSLPNFMHPDVPLSNTEEGVVIATSLLNKFPQFEGFEPKDHQYLGDSLDILDFDSPRRTTGSKFVTFKNDGALLELALAQWALQRVAMHGFSPRCTPDISQVNVLEGCGFVPRGESSQIFHVRSDSGDHKNKELCLVGTSEVTLAGSLAGEIISTSNLPLRLAGFGHCFRVEAGAAGKASKGLYRLHQFSKVEMFSFVHPDGSEKEHELLRSIQESICDELGLHWRTLNMAAHELGASAYKKYDVQVYMPSRRDFGEVASVSNCTDFQSRRLGIKFKDELNSPNGFVHTLNGTALAIPRIMLAILETHQQLDGSVKIPEPLWPFFLDGRRVIQPAKKSP